MSTVARQIIALGCALILFWVIYGYLFWEWWIAAPGALLAYGILLIVLPRAGGAGSGAEVVPGLSRDDHRQAMRQCRRAAMELKRHARKLALVPSVATALGTLADTIDKIGKSYKEDPRDVLHTRGLTDHHLDELLEIVRGYMRLHDSDLGADGQGRLRDIGRRIEGYVPRFEDIYQACLKRDFNQLEISTKALDQIMESERPGGL